MGDPGCSTDVSFLADHNRIQTETFEILSHAALHTVTDASCQEAQEKMIVAGPRCPRTKARSPVKVHGFIIPSFLAHSTILLCGIFIKALIHVNILNTPLRQEAETPQ